MKKIVENQLTFFVSLFVVTFRLTFVSMREIKKKVGNIELKLKKNHIRRQKIQVVWYFVRL